MASTSLIDRESIINTYRNNSMKDSNEFNVEIINALGGMENLLTMILSIDAHDTQLSNDQLIKLSKIIHEKSSISQQSMVEDDNEKHPDASN